MGKLNYTTAEINEQLDKIHDINFTATQINNLLTSVKPRLTYETNTSGISSFSNLTSWLDTQLSGMSVYSVRFLLFKPSAAFAPYASGRVYTVQLSKAGDNTNAAAVITQLSGSGSSTYPNMTYIRKNGGTWGSANAIVQ